MSSMQVTKLNDDNILVADDKFVKVTEMGNITEVMYSKHRNSQCYIKKVDDNHYIDLRTGELKECNHIKNRAGNMQKVAQTLKKLRGLINTNVIDPKKCKWITLTYKDDMTDTKRLYDDFKKFNKRMRYYLKQHYEYIACAEPHANGVWHLHMIMIFEDKAPFIKNDEEMSRIWGQGFTKTKNLKDVDNVGAYLTAYMTDMSLEEAKASYELIDYMIGHNNKPFVIKDVKTENMDDKRYVKGARLVLYPPKFNIYRCSRGIKQPKSYYTTEKQAKQKVSADTLTFEKSLLLYDPEKDYRNQLNYRYYNKNRKGNQ